MSALFQAPLYPILELLAKVSLVLTCGLLLGSMRRVDPALRHSILLASLCGALVLPLLAIAVPRWNAAILPPIGQVTPTRGEARSGWTASDLAGRGGSGTRVLEAGSPSETPVGASAAASTTTGRDGSSRNRPIMRSLLLAIWVLGTLLLLARLLIGRSRLRAIAARAWAPDDAPWNRLLEEEKLLAGVSGRVRLLVSPAAATPFTWGAREPVVLLPEDALEWSTERRRIVLRHELAHVARADSLAQSLAAIACAGYWFHPLALIAAKRLRTECERACDDRVVALGTQPWEYASHLLDIARGAREMGSPGLLSVGMARRSQLEGRLLDVLHASRSRATPTRRAQVVAIALPLALAVAASAFHPVPRATVQVAGDTAPGKSGAVRAAVSPAPAAFRTTPPPEPARADTPPAAADTSTLADTAAASVATPGLEHAAAPARNDVLQAQELGGNVEILLRADPTLPGSAPVQLVLSRDENLVLVNDEAAHPLHLRTAIELAKQIRERHGREIPGGSVRIPVALNGTPAMTRSLAEPYAQLLQSLLQAPLEVIEGRPAARHLRFGENARVEMAVSDSTLARLMEKSS
jgi:beta-lactamase regulating signal transducer with metallopeptidase domain